VRLWRASWSALSFQQNIEHYRAMLKMTTDSARREQIEKLRRDEETKRKKYDEDHKKK
jgi:hypothetical protein